MIHMASVEHKVPVKYLAKSLARNKDILLRVDIDLWRSFQGQWVGSVTFCLNLWYVFENLAPTPSSSGLLLFFAILNYGSLLLLFKHCDVWLLYSFGNVLG